MIIPPAPYDRIAARLAERLPEARLITDPLRLMTWGTDASLYRLIPKIVAVVESEDEVRASARNCAASCRSRR